jgi:ketosteroid isomerase-like protein
MRIHVSPSGEMAWATAQIVIRTHNSKLERTTWQTLVFEKISGVWRLVHGHASIPGQP